MRIRVPLAIFFISAAVVMACGKKGDPLPPLLRVPVAPAEFKVTRIDNEVYAQFNAPALNADGVGPADVVRVEVYGITTDRPPEIEDQQELRKLSTLKVGIGYPDVWRDYSTLKVVRGDPVGNLQRYETFEHLYHRARLDKPVDRGEWVMTPQTVNAVNLPILNAMNFPAAILQSPYFDPKAAAAVKWRCG